ncbi:peptidoglycan editing factor PgeF [Paenibacillus xerothermodurans]|uniref:Purine nucleoside phosphorylase n=1 Tax=Paenibacillus xerothermodurans TaxID=1977292 RepID=A0A2W1NHM5_PAEXE|nr:peptidoglycan editing factor PgeF [Paenibacillus xerothermodurans]PZE22641.1 peptidoglycan editing factor PgeF [Paenibacillus xerothermodurans]
MEPFVLQTERNGSELLYIKSWRGRDAGLTVGFTSRRGGVSEYPFDSLNCGLHVGDAPPAVVANRARLAEALQIGLDACTYGEQVHGNEVQIVTKQHAGAGVDSRQSALQSKDAFITNEPGVFLHVMFADCVPLYFYDPVHRAVGLAHAGWKGTVLQIAKTTVEAMSVAYGTQANQLYAAIGPSIQSCCYEVDDTVISRVSETMLALSIGNDQTQSLPVYQTLPNGKYKLSLQQLNRQIMIKAGIVPTNIEISSLCTSCRTDLFFSHRKEGGKTGRMAAWIGLYE